MLAIGILGIPGFFAVRRWRRPPNVVIIVADTLRADRLGVYGNPDGLTPFLDGLAARGTLFRHAYAASSWTCPSVASLFTSRYPSQHHMTDFDSRLASDEVTLAERLADLRYVSAGFSANFRLDPWLGWGQGFTALFPFVSQRKVTTDRLARKSLNWLSQAWNPRARRPLFVYYQLMEAHGPYDLEHEPHEADREARALLRRHGVSPDTAARSADLNARLVDMHWDGFDEADVAFLRSRYDAEVAMLDLRLRRLFAALERRGVLDKAIVVFTADHGEEFREHGRFLHGMSLFQDQIQVPLIMVGAGWPAGRIVDANVSLVDVAPTLLALLGLPAEPRFEGRSLVPYATGTAPPRDVVAEHPPAGPYDVGLHRMALVRDALKLVVPREGPAVLYDLLADPREAHPDGAHADELETLRVAADEATVALAARAGAAEHSPVDEATRRRLRALGYAN